MEHKYIIFSAYNTAIFSGVILYLVNFAENEPGTTLIIQAAGVCFGSIIVVGSIALPRLGVVFGCLSPPELSFPQ